MSRARADGVRPPAVLASIALDLDGDGRPDRAELLPNADPSFADLSITLAARGGATGPSLRKAKLIEGPIVSLEANVKGALVVHGGCGGCSNDYETTLTIVQRRAQFLVADAALDWDTRAGRGTCDIDFLDGRCVVSHGNAKPMPFRARVAPIPLAAWSNDRFRSVCGRLK